MSKKNRQFWETAKLNNATFNYYYERLVELSMSMFEWKNLPETVDPRYLELILFTNGSAVFFEDDVLGYLTLKMVVSSPLNVYNIPTERRAIANNGYQKQLSIDNSVIIYNNMLRTNSQQAVELFAKRLYDLDRTIDVNASAQKTPILLRGTESQMLTLKNAYMKYDGNMPVMLSDKDFDLKDGFDVLQTGAPFVADKLYTLKTEIWNEALTYLGISNVNSWKRERMLHDEITRNLGGTLASRYSRLESRKQACEKINKMFGLNIDCEYREDNIAVEFEEKTEDKKEENDE